MFTQATLRDYMFGCAPPPPAPARRRRRHPHRHALTRHLSVFVRHGNDLLQALRNVHRSGGDVDIQRLYFAFTLDSIGEIAFGVNIGSLHNPDHPFARAFDTAQKLCEARFFSPVFELAPCLHPREWRLRRAVRVLDKFAFNVRWQPRPWPLTSPPARLARHPSFVTPTHTTTLLAFPHHARSVTQVIGARRAALASTAESDTPREDLLTRFMMHRDQDTGKPYEDRFLRDVVLNFIIAGRDTTAQALSWCTYLLTQNPDKEAKVRGPTSPPTRLADAPPS